MDIFMDKDMSLCMRGVAGDLDFRIPKDFPKTAYHPSRSMAQQSFAKDADINTIMSRYAVSGVLVDPSNVDSARVPRFGDFSALPDYAGTIALVRQAQDDFMTLPSALRARFDNDVGKFLEFFDDPKNIKELVLLKLKPETDAAYLLAVKAEQDAMLAEKAKIDAAVAAALAARDANGAGGSQPASGSGEAGA